jgi:hypothetical protein
VSHKLVKHGLVELHRGLALKLFWKLTGEGRERANIIYTKILKEQAIISFLQANQSKQG